jgi:hypothetical protein
MAERYDKLYALWNTSIRDINKTDLVWNKVKQVFELYLVDIPGLELTGMTDASNEYIFITISYKFNRIIGAINIDLVNKTNIIPHLVRY